MADIIHQFQATIPPGTTKASPFSVKIPLPSEVVQLIDLDVPPGPAGLMGFYLAVSGQQMIPFEMGEWLVWDDREKSWPVENFPTSATWSIVGYNLGVFAHTITVRFHSQSAVQTSPNTIIPSVTFVASPDSDQVGILL